MGVAGESAAGEFDLARPISSFVNVVRRIALHPVRFFAGLPRHGSLLNPLLFALICSVVATIMGGVLSLLGVRETQGLQAFLNPAGGSLGSSIEGVIFDVIYLFVGSGILHLVVRLIVGAGNSGYGATFRTLSYAYVVNLVYWIPIIGPLLSLYGLYLAIVGLREMHETTTGRAILAFVTFSVVFILLAVVVGIVEEEAGVDFFVI